MNLKKLLSAIGLLAIAGPVTVSVVACGSPTQTVKTDLKDIITETTVNGNIANTITDVIKEVVSNIKQYVALTADDLEIKDKDFTEAKINIEGKAKITAKEKSNFTGEVDIRILALEKIELKTVLTTTVVNGNEANDESSVLNKIAQLNSESGLKEQDITIENFIPANTKNNGSATISAKEESDYKGTVDITIAPLEHSKERFQEILDEIVEKGLTVKILPTDSIDLGNFIEESIKSAYPENYDGLEFSMNIGDEQKDDDDNIISIQADLYITQDEETLAEILNKTITFVQQSF